MTTLFIPKETKAGETRVPVTPAVADKLVKLGARVRVESGLGDSLRIPDDEYKAVGAEVATDRSAALAEADLVLRLNKPAPEDVACLKKGAIHVSYVDPFFDADLVRAFADASVTCICMEMIPRTTLAQKMDALSSQANLAGYVSVIVAAERLDQCLPMMMTPAGTIAPSRVFVIGAGVAGLQAIATAKRLGARVDAFDTRPEVEEQVKSLGAKFLKVDLGETGGTDQGYAKQLTEEQLEKQRQAMAKQCAQSDIVITTAQVFGRKAPVIVTEDMVKGMKPGSVLVDLAVETGGNVAGAKAGEEVEIGGVRIIGLRNLPGRVAVHASQMYASNLGNLVAHFWNEEQGTFGLDLSDEILAGCVLTHDGAIVHERFKDSMQQSGS